MKKTKFTFLKSKTIFLILHFPKNKSKKVTLLLRKVKSLLTDLLSREV
jgi:hypothetical protein